MQSTFVRRGRALLGEKQGAQARGMHAEKTTSHVQIFKAHQYNSSKRFNKNYVPIHIGGIYVIGIYKITNLVNGKSYIGQSVNIQKRFNAHKSVAFNPNDANYNYPLYRAIRKYGLENFSFEVLEECDISELNNKEIYYISKYNTYGKCGYNQDKGGNNA